MTRRELFNSRLWRAAWAAAEAAVVVLVRLVMDGEVKVRPEALTVLLGQHFWPQAAKNFEACGVRSDSQIVNGEIWCPPGLASVIRVGATSG